MYCTSDDIIPSTGALVPRSKLEAIIGEPISPLGDDQFATMLAGYIGMASSEIDSIIGSLYQTPVPSTATLTLGMLKNPAILLTIGYVYTMNSDGKIPEGIQAQIEMARRTLQMYGAGGTYNGRIFVPMQYPDAPMNATYGIVSPTPICPSASDIALAHPILR